ncbi:MAG TPA: formate dehydrogenase [Syntrophothermus lipocalidus]|uniref:Formate dehydrogenase gamma subunit n=1 Tax=Syntrophothermus lipocalidus (strain DSM 12680 / TGB-C1) TaxID=643648 RepID=D7CNB0_SYNLT|nr:MULTISPECIES: cytochrome b/b6 domain-containing protein [Syntrophothermus]ADI02195.1 formate dehydrogenase gamma subunit [Syntrophothermus lipocalidus DSM 12680]NSW82000.1 cytochrome b/b6 domain-containing protein [Syntrophothermus sp.]HHV75962.1 formate dehydrogenase [Syntrophothermus lipocalidus]
MQWLVPYKEDVPRVERFNLTARITHWGHTVTYLLCLFTGLILFVDGADWLAAIFGGYRGAGLVHRIAAVGMTIFVIYGAVFGIRGLGKWIMDLFRFGVNDIIFLVLFPLEFFGFKVKMPPQTRFNGGEKGNSIITPTCVLLLMLSGYIMWFPQIFPAWLVSICYPVHDLAMIFSAFMVCMHAYLGSFHPGSGESFWGMWKGTVRADWAEHHHKIWYDETYGEKAKAN